MATHRTIVSILEEKLQDTSKGVLSEFAQRELEGVIMQLRAQNDQWLRIEKHDGILREHHEELAEIKHSLHTIEKCLLDINTQKNS